MALTTQGCKTFHCTAHSQLKTILLEESIWLKYWAFISCYWGVCECSIVFRQIRFNNNNNNITINAQNPYNIQYCVQVFIFRATDFKLDVTLTIKDLLICPAHPYRQIGRSGWICDAHTEALCKEQQDAIDLHVQHYQIICKS